MKKIYILISMALLILTLAGCNQTKSEQIPEILDNPVIRPMTITLGSVMPLTGEAAVYGETVQRVVSEALLEANSKLEDKNIQLQVRYEDGKCSGKDALSAAQNLINLHGVKIIVGGLCSGETLGIAPYSEEKKILLFSPLSSSPEVTDAGDYVFRNSPSDIAQIDVLAKFISNKGWKTAAIISENTDYAQALRNGYLQNFKESGIEVVADEVVAPNVIDIRTEVNKVKTKNPDVLIFLPQTGTTAGAFAKQIFESGIESEIVANEVVALDNVMSEYGDYLQGIYVPESYFEMKDHPLFLEMTNKTKCELDHYCASSYDSILLLGELIGQCGEDTTCLRDKLYAVKDWDGKFTKGVTIDENGDVAGDFLVKQVSGKELLLVE